MNTINVTDTNTEIWFTSDTHFSHQGIINNCFRPYSTTNQMDKELIDNWNKVVKPNDVVFHLGDFFFSNSRNPETTDRTNYLLGVLHGYIHLIRGNHDGRAITRAKGWCSVSDMLMVNCYKKQKIVLNHFCQLVWDKSHYGSWHLYGHSHGTLGQENDKHKYSKLLKVLVDHMKIHDVGVDNNNYFPISFWEVADIMEKKEKIPVDYHHGFGKNKINFDNYCDRWYDTGSYNISKLK